MLKYRVSASTLQTRQCRQSLALDEHDCSMSSNGSTSTSGHYSPGSSTGGGRLTIPVRSNSGVHLRTRSASVTSLSSNGSASTSAQDNGVEWGTVRVHTASVRADVEYKTLFVSTATTTAELLKTLLTKFRLLHKDTNLYYITMVILTRVEGGAVHQSTLHLDDTARPLALQHCHAPGMSHFELRQHQGVLVRIHDACIDAASNYKSILIAPHTSTSEAIDLLLRQQRVNNNKRQYVIVKRKRSTKEEHLLPMDVALLSLMETDPAETFELHLRPYNGAHAHTFEHIEEVETPQSPPVESVELQMIKSSARTQNPTLRRHVIDAVPPRGNVNYYDSLRRPIKRAQRASTDWSTKSIRAIAMRLQNL